MANDELSGSARNDELTDDGLCNLFAAFDEVSASDELQEATLARILAATGAAEAAAAAASPSDASLEGDASSAPLSPRNAAAADWDGEPVAVRAVAGGKPARAVRKAKWRAVRVAAVAACLTLALTGGVAYAVPASYYDVAQDGATVTLGVNVFGVTVSATSDDEAGEAVIASADLCGVPYEESLSRAIDAMEARDPDAPVEFGPQGGDRETVRLDGDARGGDEPADVEPHGDGDPRADVGPRSDGDPSDAGGRAGNAGQPNGEDAAPSEPAPGGDPRNPADANGEGDASRPGQEPAQEPDPSQGPDRAARGMQGL